MASQKTLTSEDGNINQTEILSEANELQFENAVSRSDNETLNAFTMLLDFWRNQFPNVSSYLLNLWVVLAWIVNEIIALATLESPLWRRSQREEMLTLNEYYSRFFPWYAKNVPRFVHEASRASEVIHVDASWLLTKLLYPIRWVTIFPSLVGNVSIESSNDDVRMIIDMEFLTPVIPTRKVKVLRYCHRIANDTWIIADISMYLSSYSDDLRPEFLRFPSGFIIKHVARIFRVTNSAGKNNLLQASKRLVHIFCSGTCGVIGNRGRWLGAGRRFDVRVFSLESRDMIRHPYGIISASGLTKIHAKPEILFPLIYGVKKLEIHNHLRLSGNDLKQVLRITRDDITSRNDVSLFSFRLNNSTEVYLLQEAYNEASSSLVIHSILDVSSLAKIINGDRSYSFTYPCGFTIMPGQNSGDEDAGCVVSVGFLTIATEEIVANTLVSDVERNLSATITNFENVLAGNQ
ncbi:putative START domain-containing protein [Arabidopsis thaliana]